MKLAAARKRVGLTQAQVAQELGVTDSAVNQWEKGKTFPKTSLLPKLAKLYGCEIGDLLETE